MLLTVDPGSPVPIYEQIVTQVTLAVAGGAPAAGELLPSVRETAGRLLVNPNTVARAYQELERLGVLATRRGVGMEVTAEAADVCRGRRRELVRERLRSVLRDAAAGGLTGDEVRAMLDDELARPNGRKRR
jgi:GntR family transcriptional regulator